MKYFILLIIALYSNQSKGFLIPIHSNITKATLTEEEIGFDQQTVLRIASHNLAIDFGSASKLHAAHGDANKLAATSARLVEKMTETIYLLERCHRHVAMRPLAQALHATPNRKNRKDRH